jgi:hypothetical protein
MSDTSCLLCLKDRVQRRVMANLIPRGYQFLRARVNRSTNIWLLARGGISGGARQCVTTHGPGMEEFSIYAPWLSQSLTICR